MYVKKWNPELDSFQIVRAMEVFRSKEDFMAGLIHSNADERVIDCVVNWWGAKYPEIAYMVATHKKSTDYHLLKVIEQSSYVPAIVSSIEHKRATEEVFQAVMNIIDKFTVEEQISIKSAIDKSRERIEAEKNTLRYKVTSKCLSLVQCMNVAFEHGMTNAFSFFYDNVISRFEEKPYVNYELPQSEGVKYNLDDLSATELFELGSQVEQAKKKRFGKNK